MAQALRIAIILFMVCYAIVASPSVGYRWKLNLRYDGYFDCNNQTCDGRLHSSCLADRPINESNCDKLKLLRVLELNNQEIKMLLLGHNGLRNRVAIKSIPRVANMNLLHWDMNLQRMAEGWIKQCTVGTDACEFIGDKNTTVGQNIRFELVERLPPHPQWIIRIVKHWFLDNFIGAKGERRTNYSQMIWPQAELVGCAAAEYYHGYMLACNYQPLANGPIVAQFKPGRPCSACPVSRPGCSQQFNGLCGIDIPLSGRRVQSNLPAVCVLLAIVYAYNVFSVNPCS